MTRNPRLSGDTLPYAVDREIEDIEALIDHAGGPAFLYGHSSGGTLAMQAAVRLGGRVSKIAIYEPPHNDDPDAQESWSEYLRELGQVLADGRRGDAVARRPSRPRWLTTTPPSSASHLRMLEGQTHDVNPGVLAPVLADFFTS